MNISVLGQEKELLETSENSAAPGVYDAAAGMRIRTEMWYHYTSRAFTLFTDRFSRAEVHASSLGGERGGIA
jgi:hypothetical protein